MRNILDIRVERRGASRDPKVVRIGGLAASRMMPTTAKKTTKTTKTGD